MMAICAVSVLNGCAWSDPYQRSGMWHPTNVNAGNLAAMVADPWDLTRGRGDPSPGVRTSTDAVDRMWRRVPTVPSSTTASASGIQAVGATATAAGGAR